ncbi:MAG: hypothetical protein ACREXT_05070, partial [Gammaproteobacteria bacterium]
KLSAHAIRQLNERITYRFTLAPFTPHEIRDYLHARLRASGYRGEELFSRRAIRHLTKHSRGLLRRINVLADKALLAAYSSSARTVRAPHVDLAARDSEFSRDRSSRWPWFAMAGLLIALTFSASGWRAQPLPAFVGDPFATPPAGDRRSRASVGDAEYQDFTNLSYALASNDTAASGTDEAEISGIAQVFENLERLVGPPTQVLSLGVDSVVHP